MKICLPTRDGVIDAHFGHCDHYTIYTIENGKIVAEETMSSPEGCGCKSVLLLCWHRLALWSCWVEIWATARKMC